MTQVKGSEILMPLHVWQSESMHLNKTGSVTHCFIFFTRLTWVSESQSNSWVLLLTSLELPQSNIFYQWKMRINEPNLLECRDKGKWKGNKLYPNPLPAKAEGNEWERGQHSPAEVFSVIFPRMIEPNLVYEKWTKATEVKEWNLELIL